jgi:hypothetical protein
MRVVQYIVIANALLLILQTVRCIATYSAVYSLSERNWRRQLPLHVWLVSTSYLMYLATTTYYLYVTPEPSGVSRTVLYLASGLIGQYALWNVLSYDRRRYSSETNFSEAHDDPGTTAPEGCVKRRK